MADVQGVNQVQAALSGVDSTFQRAALAGARAYAANLENLMKAGAPWTDRTSAARNSLQAAAGMQGGVLTVVASGGMTYSPYLETRYGGKYAIILKSLQQSVGQFLPSVVAALKGAGW